MSLTKGSLWRSGALALLAGAALAFPTTAKADITQGLSLRAGIFTPSHGGLRDLTDFGAWGGGLEYKVSFIPQLLNGDYWSTSISADFHYSERNAGIFRYIPVSINQIYTFEGDDPGRAPYAGFCVTAATFGSTLGEGGGQPTVTRIGGGLILGMNWDRLYFETRYEWIDRHGSQYNPEGFRTYVGFRF
ncbi:MAG: hypothetical protein IT208_16050 [Chthonomonadales bacterium]|nr:hypothetical protein [Chthonomonadales bacterium]